MSGAQMQRLKNHDPDSLALDHMRRSSLTHAVLANDPVRVRNALDDGCQVYHPDLNGKTPVHYAIDAGNLEVLELLLSHDRRGINDCRLSTVVDFESGSLLIYAAACSNPGRLQRSAPTVDIIRLLMRYGADPHAVNEHGYNALHGAFYHEDLQLAHFLLQEGVTPSAKNAHAMTLLHRAVQVGNTDLVDLALDWGGYKQLHKKSEPYKHTPLHMAVLSGDINMSGYLIRRGAHVNVTDYVANNPMHDAVKLGGYAMIWLLARSGADLNQVTNACKYTPFHRALLENKPDMMEQLYLLGADPMLTDHDGFSPLEMAARAGFTLCLKSLMENIRLEQQDPAVSLMLTDALFEAVFYKEWDCARYLIDYVEDINKKTRFGSTVLRAAIDQAGLEYIEGLLARGADPNAPARGMTPLVHAINSGLFGVVELLLKAEADPNLPANNIYPLHAAVEKKNAAMVASLLAAGARTSVQDKFGSLPIDRARQMGLSDIVSCLEIYSQKNLPVNPRRTFVPKP